MLNPIWLQTFVTLIDTGHFTQTAEKLFMTQPGVSQHIKKLEQACGHNLIQRDKKHFEITEQGKVVYQYAQTLKVNEQKLREQLAFDNPHEGVCSIASSGSLALILYPKLLKLQAQHRQLAIHLKAAPNHQILDEVIQGSIDIGIVTHVPKPTLFDVQIIGQEQLCLVLPSSIDKDECNHEQLTALGLISHPDAEHYLSLYFAENQQSGFSNVNIHHFPISGYINQISQILEPVAQGLGFTVLPKSAVDSFHARKQLTIIKPLKPVLETLYIVKKRNRTMPARFNTLQSQLTEHFE